jgi:hypothetical protein
MVDDPLSLDLKPLFRKPDMFDSAANWHAAGFKIIRDSDSATKILVAKHKAVNGYLFKKHINQIPLKEQLQRYTRRIEGARKLRTLIEEMNFKHIIVSPKWLYELPFSQQAPSYIVIVRELPVFSPNRRARTVFDRVDDESEKIHRRIDLDVLRELCVVWFRCKDLDFTAKNAPFTKQGQVAFVDTGYLDWQDHRNTEEVKRGYMKCAERYLSGSRLEYAKTRLIELSGAL